PCGKGILSPLRLPVSPPGPAIAGGQCVPRWTSTALGGGRRLEAGNGTRTRDPNLGKVVLYQLSYSRARRNISSGCRRYRPTMPTATGARRARSPHTTRTRRVAL